MEQQGVVNLNFSINGNKVLEPENWQDLTEVFEYGQNSNQPSIDSEQFTFKGNAANLILDHIHPNGMLNPGNILVPLTLNVEYTQQGNTQRLIDDYIIDTTNSLQLNDAWFNNEFKPKEVVCTIRKKNGSDYFLTEIQGLTWGLLLEEGAVTSSDYTTIKTVVIPIYNFLDVVMALLTIYSLQKQLSDSVEDAKTSVYDLVQRVTAATALVPPNPVIVTTTIIYQSLITALKIAAAIILLALTIKIALDTITLLLPPVLNNKGMTLRRGMEVICKRLGKTFVSNLSLLDDVCLMPSGAHSNGKNIIKDNLPSWFGNKRGVPNDYDPGYIAVDYVEIIKKLVNGRIDVIDSVVHLRNEDDQSLFIKGGYKHRIQPNYTNVEYNLPEIPHTRLFSFAIDETEGYTTEYQDGRMWEVKNISNVGNLPFTAGEYIDFNLSLGHRKTKVSIIEKLVGEIAAVGDQVSSLFGANPKLQEKFLDSRTGKLQVTQNNFSKAKLIPIKNGRIPSNYLDVLSAKAIEEKYYINRSIVRGAGQKLILRGLEVPMSLADRELVKENGNFQDDYWGNCTFKKVEYQFSRDTAVVDITVDNNYIASNTFTERTYNGTEG